MTSSLYERSLYLNKDIDYIINSEIREYDLKSAGLSLIKEFQLAPPNVISQLERMDKEPRNKEIGMMQKDKAFADALKDAFGEARRMFFEANGIEDGDVLSIKKDAIFIVRKNCDGQITENLDFRIKNQYLGYMYLNRIEFYYRAPTELLDVKGLGPEVYTYHGDYMLDYIRDIFSSAIYSSHQELIRYICKFVTAYRLNYLEYGYYRRMDESFFYDVMDPDVGLLHIRDINENEDVHLDITYNYFKYLVPIANIFI